MSGNGQPMNVTFTEAEREWIPGGTFHRDFVDDFARVSVFFPYDPRSPGSCVRRREYIVGEWGADRASLSSWMLQENTAWGAAVSALADAKNLRDRESAVVLAQVRPSLLGGTGEVLLKALSVIEYAKRLSSLVDLRVVPVLWVISDHNWASIGRVHMAGRDGHLHKLALGFDASGRPVGEVHLHPEIDELIGRFEAITGVRGTEDELCRLLRATSRESGSLVEWFCRLITELFSYHGLLLVDENSPRTRRRLASVLQRAAIRRYSIENELEVGADMMARRGYSPAFDTGSRGCHLFMDTPEGRVQLYREEEGFRDLSGEVRFSARRMTEILLNEPERFSPGEVLRPVVQGAALPVLATVVSADESPSRAQAKGVHELMDAEAPPVFPQLSLTFIEPEIAREIRERDFPLHTLLGRDGGRPEVESLLQKELADLDEGGIDESFDEAWRGIEDAHRQLLDSLRAHLPSLEPLGEAALARMEGQMEYLREKAHQHHRRDNRDLVSAYRRIRNTLRPRGRPQEELGYLPLLAGRGRRWLGGVVEALSAHDRLWGHFHVEWTQ